MALTPDDIQDLVTIAFCLEPLADKPGCTTRFVDLPGKPLTDFVIAGINSGRHFRALAKDVGENPETDIFAHFVPALVATNAHKSAKTINFGLLEIMFAVVYARLHTNDPDQMVDQISAALRRPNQRDVLYLIAARKEAWQSSEKEDRKFFPGDDFVDAASPYDFYLRLLKTYPPDHANHQWATQFTTGLPAFCEARAALKARPADPLGALAEAFRQTKVKDSTLKNGIIADMGAAALFVHLSFARRST